MLERTPAPRVVSGEPDLQRSSCELKTSVRGVDIQVKAYVGSPLHPAVDEAIGEYFRAFDRIQAELLGRGVRA